MKNIAVVCGGYSGEYEISISSAQVVADNLDKSRYRSFLVVITRDRWYHENTSGTKLDINRKDFSLTMEDDTIVFFEGVFNAIHGTPGEDGKLLGYLDMLEIPYTSCSADVSALTFNKFLCNKFIASFGINLAKGFSFVKGESIDTTEVISQLGLPLFVKPACSGSSVGISKVKTIEELSFAIEKAYKEDDRVIIEEFLPGREMACGVVMKKEDLLVFPLTEIISKNEFFDYEAKYTLGMADEITPPENLDEKSEIDIKALSSFLYKKLNCKGFIRVDYILTERGLYFIEINTVPGISNASILPQQAQAMGLGIEELFTIVTDAMFE